MNTEELKNKLEDIDYWQEEFANKTFLKALVAVVEFIKDIESDSGIIANKEFNQGVTSTCRSIIQAIEKALK